MSYTETRRDGVPPRVFEVQVEPRSSLHETLKLLMYYRRLQNLPNRQVQQVDGSIISGALAKLVFDFALPDLRDRKVALRSIGTSFRDPLDFNSIFITELIFLAQVYTGTKETSNGTEQQEWRLKIGVYEDD